MKFPLENYDPTEFALNDYEEKEDEKPSSTVETFVSTIKKFEMSILDVTDIDKQFTTNDSDEISLSSIEKEEHNKTVSNIIKKVPAKSCTQQIKSKGEDLLDADDSEEIILHSIKKEEDKKTVSGIIVKVPMKPTTEQIKAEEDDLFDPRWDKIKCLSTDKDRYQQVKNCWKCSTVPDPNKNLTYYSFRKRHFKDTKISRPQQRKRMASNNLNEHTAKRSRSCTYHLDHQIQTVSAKERQETEKIMQEMNTKICRVNKRFKQKAKNSYAFGQLQANLENKIASIRSQYRQQTNHCIAKVESEIHALNVARNEVLQFYKFYKGLNSRNDPTVLTFEQNLELEEIENIYSKFDQLYK